jgi:hypothetical protein
MGRAGGKIWNRDTVGRVSVVIVVGGDVSGRGRGTGGKWMVQGILGKQEQRSCTWM